MRQNKIPFDCPVCGERVPASAVACPECGACDKSGWSGEPDIGHLGLADEDFDYQKFVADEFEGGPKKSSMQWVWWLAALLAFLAMLWTVLPR